MGNQLQYRRVNRVVQMTHRVIITVYRQRVLDQVVGADGQEVHVFDKAAHYQRSRGDFDHRPDFHLIGEGDVLFAQLFFGVLQLRQCLLQLAQPINHGEQDADLAVHGSAQQRA